MPRGHLKMSGDTYICHNGKQGASGIKWVEARDADKNIRQITDTSQPTHTHQRISISLSIVLRLRKSGLDCPMVANKPQVF